MKEKKLEFNPTPEMLQSAKNVFMAMAHRDIIKPIVEGYEKKILEDLQPKYRKDSREQGTITNLDHTYLMEDETFLEFNRRCHIERMKANLHVSNPEFCPLLEAEEIVRQANNKLLDSLGPVTGINSSKALRCGMENYRKMIDLSLRLVVRYMPTGEKMMEELKKC